MSKSGSGLPLARDAADMTITEQQVEEQQACLLFQTALETSDLDAIRRVPKSDLHNHFFLGGNRALVSEWAGKDIAPLDHKLDSMAEMHEWVQAQFGALFGGAQGRLRAFEAHVGEWGSADSVQRAVEELELDEVQHGIAAAQSTSVMKFLADNRIRLNICPTSNVLLGRADSLAGHPIRKLYDAGVKVTINTDDVLVFGQSVSDEFLNLYRAALFDAAELDEIRQNGLIDSPGCPSSRINLRDEHQA
jgi:hypothetical protein